MGETAGKNGVILTATYTHNECYGAGGHLTHSTYHHANRESKQTGNMISSLKYIEQPVCHNFHHRTKETILTMSEMRKEENGPKVSESRKLRVLCLHGFRTSGSFLQKQVSKWDSSIIDKLDMSFLDGLFPAGGKSDIEGIFPPPYYEWFQYNEDFTEYTNLDKGLAFIADYMEKNGPFDGLLGFSQGATLSGALVGYQRKGVLLKNHPPIKFIISVSGTKFRKPEMCEILYSPTIECPSVHMIGAKDWLKEPSEEFSLAFKDPVVIKHPQGHTVPRLDAEAVKQLSKFIDSLALKGAEEKPENGHMFQCSSDHSADLSKPICKDMVDGITPIST